MTTARQTTEAQESLAEQLKRGEDELRRIRSDFMAIAGDVRILAQKETELARAELMEQVDHVKRGAILGGVALVASALALIFLFVTVMLVLNTFMPLWLAAVFTTLIIAGAAIFTGSLAMQQFKRFSLKPARTLASVREDVEWARNQMRSSAT